MNVHDPARTPELGEAAASTRPSVFIAENGRHARMVFFRIAPGQEVPTHTSASSVILAVVSGSGFVRGRDGEEPVSAGMVASIAPDEPHGMRAAGEELVLVAVITPGPGAA
jgi:quercetin dioxygenase-like cupin family protein